MTVPTGSASIGELSEEEFIARARRFLCEIGGAGADTLDLDANLLESGILDSLAIIAYVGFIEEQRGSELEMGPEELGLLMTIRSSYLLVRPAASPNAE